MHEHLESDLPTQPPSATRSVAQVRPLSLPIANGWRRIALLTLGGLFFCLGVLGAFLPGLPATPFLMLTSYFLIRSSPRWNDKLLQSRVFGSILSDWQYLHKEQRSIVVDIRYALFLAELQGAKALLTELFGPTK